MMLFFVAAVVFTANIKEYTNSDNRAFYGLVMIVLCFILGMIFQAVYNTPNPCT